MNEYFKHISERTLGTSRLFGRAAIEASCKCCAFAAIAVGVVAAGAAIGSAYVKGQAANAAADAQAGGLRSMEPLNIDELKTLASDTDIARYQKQFAVQRENDPTYAGLRDQGGSSLLQLLLADRSGNSASDQALKGASDEAAAGRSETDSFISTLLDRAKADLDAGATLPPEFQAELVKAGLEGAGANGVSMDGRGAAGTEIRSLLGAQGLALKQERESNARTNLGAAEVLRQQRAQALTELATLGNNLTNSKAARAGAGITVGNATVPAIGLNGQDAANLSIRNTDFENQRKLALANLKAQKDLNNGAFLSSTISSVGSAVSGGLGQGGWISSLINSGASPQAAGVSQSIANGLITR